MPRESFNIEMIQRQVSLPRELDERLKNYLTENGIDRRQFETQMVLEKLHQVGA